jgi:hypothetical protein
VRASDDRDIPWNGSTPLDCVYVHTCSHESSSFRPLGPQKPLVHTASFFLTRFVSALIVTCTLYRSSVTVFRASLLLGQVQPYPVRLHINKMRVVMQRSRTSTIVRATPTVPPAWPGRAEAPPGYKPRTTPKVCPGSRCLLTCMRRKLGCISASMHSKSMCCHCRVLESNVLLPWNWWV